MQTINVFSSNGSLTVSKETGEVIECFQDKDATPINDIARFDLEEFRRAYPNEAIPDNIDILDLGFWTITGAYEGPETEWRAEFQRHRNPQIISTL